MKTKKKRDLKHITAKRKQYTTQNTFSCFTQLTVMVIQNSTYSCHWNFYSLH